MDKRSNAKFSAESGGLKKGVVLKYLIELSGICKSFPGVKALDDVQFNLMAGEVHALLGENGAGKSTLMKIISGIYHRDSGSYRIEGNELEELTPKTAQ